MGKNKTSFWPNYVDIMTTLFCIMLVLFVVSYSQFKVTEAELQKLAGKYKEIENIYKTVENIDSTYFKYDSEYIKHIFKIQVQFQKGEFDLYHLVRVDTLLKRMLKIYEDQLRMLVLKFEKQLRIYKKMRNNKI